MGIQEKLKDWAKKVIEKYDCVAVKENRSYYTQSNLIEIDDNNQVKVLILGINPGSTGEYRTKITPDAFLQGNTYFSQEREIWHLWNGLKKIFKAGEIDDILNKEKDFAFSNIYHFDTHSAKDLANKIKNDNEYIALTIELIEILNPQMVICLGKNDCMCKLIKKPESIIDGELSYGEIKKIPIYGIPHTSKFYTNEESTMLGKVLGALYKKEVKPEKGVIAKLFKNEIKAFKDRRDQIKPANILKSMIEDSFKKYVEKEKWEKEENWYKISPNFVIRVASCNPGYVTIRDCGFDTDNNYSKRTISKQEEIIEHLKTKGFELNDTNKATSLGHKRFDKYEDWRKGPQHVVLEILKEIEELGTDLEHLYSQKISENS